VAISLGARSYVANLIGAHYLRQAFEIGQRIRVAGFEGRVLDVSATAVVLALALPVLAEEAPLVRFDPSRYSSDVTECDRLAAHPEDPYAVAPGRTRAQILAVADRAIAACELAVVADPHNPRLHYQLARVYGYSGQGEKSLPHRQAAVDAHYPQSLFVVGYLYLTGLNKNPKDTCRAGELIRESAQQGRLAGQVGFVRYTLQGLFDQCPVRKDADEMLAFLTAARATVGGDYYQGLLVDVLEEQVRARRQSPQSTDSQSP